MRYEEKIRVYGDGKVEIENLLRGKKVKIFYDRHIVSTLAECSSSELNCIEGGVKEVYDGLILISYVSRMSVPSIQKGVFSDKTVYVEKNVKVNSLINMKYIIKIDIVEC